MQQHTQNEEWRPVVGHEGVYEVSNFGNVRSLDRVVETSSGPRRYRGKVLSPGAHPEGHLTVCIERRSRWVHQLVLEAFVGPRPEGAVTCHRDDDPQNNYVGNLRWDSQAANVKDAIKNGRHLPSNKTHCDYGHPLGTFVSGERRRVCRECARRRGNAYNERLASKYTAENPPPITRTHCSKGHALKGENLRLTSGRWICRECNRERCRKHYQRNIGRKTA